MAWPIIAAIAISVASKIAGGMTGASSLSSNAQTAMDVGASNAQAALNVGKWNADAIIDMAKINMELGTFSSMLEVSEIMAVAEYNAELRTTTAEYDALLLEKEADLIYQELGLNEYLLESEVDKIVASAQARFAANGLVINEGTAADVTIDQRTQEAMQKFIYRVNADNNANRILNEAALTRWNGEVEAQSLMWEAKINASSVINSQLIENLGTYSQSSYDAANEIMNANLQAQSILTDAAAQASSYTKAASSAMWGGLFGAGGSAASIWGSSYTGGGGTVGGASLGSLGSNPNTDYSMTGMSR